MINIMRTSINGKYNPNRNIQRRLTNAVYDLSKLKLICNNLEIQQKPKQFVSFDHRLMYSLPQTKERYYQRGYYVSFDKP